MKNYITIVILFSIISILNANDEIDNLLADIHHKSDLSEKTKLANEGISFIYTRNDLDRMQARYLKDILKSNYLTKYKENKFGVVDPFSQGNETLPFKSSQVRVYLDNQEITAGTYGSGLVLYGNIDIGFADHIEVYTRNPTYEFSTESTLTLIKIYSKGVLKDAGSKLEVNAGSYSSSRVSGYTSDHINDDWSYFAYLSLHNDNRDNPHSNGELLSRDKEINHLFTSFSDDNKRILIDIIDQKRDAFISTSPDATPEKSFIGMKSIHIGYDTNYENFFFLASYDYSYTDYIFVDNVTPLIPGYPIFNHNAKTRSDVFTSELKYNIMSQNNKLTTGLKYRVKTYKNEVLRVNDIDIPQVKNDEQTVFTAFVEDKYSIQENQILTIGLQFSGVHNNYSSQDDELFMYRLGYTLINNDWTFKTILAHTEDALEPYLVDSQLYLTPGAKKTKETDYIHQDIIFEKENNTYELLIGYNKIKNAILKESPSDNLLDNYSKDVFVTNAIVRWTHKYNRYDKLYTSFDYLDRRNLPTYSSAKEYNVVIRNLNTYKKFDFFSEFLFTHTSINNDNSYDLSLGMKYNHNSNLSLSIKGENILDKAQETLFARSDPSNLEPISPISISPIDRKLIISLEYYF